MAERYCRGFGRKLGSYYPETLEAPQGPHNELENVGNRSGREREVTRAGYGAGEAHSAPLVVTQAIRTVKLG